MKTFTVSGNIVDVVHRRVFTGTVAIKDGIIAGITPCDGIVASQYIMPGFIDAHVHIESSMLIPSEFARLAVTHGTVGTVSDPHEIGNVLGAEGVQYMMDNGGRVPFHFYFGVPSCVPATSFETAGASIDANQIRHFFKNSNLKYLSEMMNYPGVIARDPLVMDKILAAQELGLPIDGHAPGLKGGGAEKYFSAGISTDHECYRLDEALDKLRLGVKILIREGSAAKNYDALHTLISSHPEEVMFCCDDKHPHELVKGHIDQIVRRSIVKHGYDIMDVLRCATFNPIKHYRLDAGLLQIGDSADFIIVDNLHDLTVYQTYIKGSLVAEKGKTLIKSIESPVINQFNATAKRGEDFAVEARGGMMQVIRAFDGELITEKLLVHPKISENKFVANIEGDILKLAVVNRYADAPVSIGFINGFGLKRGAIASCIAHDSHNIITVGTCDTDICRAVNAIIEQKGGVAVVDGDRVDVLPLPVAGIMSHRDGYEVAEQYSKLDGRAKELGTVLHDPFMTLSFMALLVIPSLKLSDRGLFDGNHFCFTPLCV